MKRSIFLIITLSASLICLGQGHWRIYTSGNGLASNFVKRYLIRNSGDIWLLTGNTINVFDGNVWTNINQITDAISGEQMDFDKIVYLNEDPDGHVWLGSEMGLFEYDDTQWMFHKENWNKKFGYQGFSFKYYSMDAQGYIWAFLEKIELFPTDFSKKWTIGIPYRFTGKEWEIYIHHGGRYAQGAGEKSKYFKRFYNDSYGNFWVITYNGFRIWDGEKWYIHDGIKEKEFDCIVKDREGNTWMGNKYGLKCFNGKDWTTYQKQDGLSATWVYFLYVDEKNRVWALTKSQNYNMFKGLDCYQNNRWVNYDYKKEGFLLPIISANHPGDGKFWLGCQSGISVFDGTSWKSYAKKDGLLEGKYKWIIKDKNNKIWASNNDKFLLKLNNDKWEPFFKKESTDKLWWFNVKYVDSNGNLWLGVNNNGIYKFDGEVWSHFTKEKELKSNLVQNIFEDKHGNIWFLTANGVSVYNE